MSTEREHETHSSDGLGPFGETGGEVETSTVGFPESEPFSQAGPGEERSPIEVVGKKGGEGHNSGGRLGDANRHHDSGVDSKVGHDVEEAAELGRTELSGEGAVESVEYPVRGPQGQTQQPLVDNHRNAGAHTDEEAKDGDVVGSQAGSADSRGELRERWRHDVTNRRVEHMVTPLVAAMPAVLLPALLSIAALIGVLSVSLRPGAIVGGSYSLDAWNTLRSDPTFLSSVWFTTRTALLATALSLLIAAPLALGVRRLQGHSVRTALGAVVPVPHLVAASVLVTWWGPGGLLDRLGLETSLVGDRFGWGIIAVYVMKEVPFLVLLTHASFTAQVARREAAARSLGAGRLRRWCSVTVPAIARPLVLGGMVVVAFAIGSTEVPAVIGPLEPEALTNWSITRVRLRGPIARADAAAALVTSSLLVFAVLGAMAAGLRILRGRQ